MQQLISALFVLCLYTGCATEQTQYSIPSEFEEQEYIWLSWVDSGFLGSDPFYFTTLEAMKAIVPHARVRLFYAPREHSDKPETEQRILKKLLEHKIDTSRVELFYNDRAYGAIQDPGPIFLRDKHGNLALSDFKFSHPDQTVEAIDRKIAGALGLPVVSSSMVSEGGAWQTNGKGTVLLVESVELDRNPGMSKIQIENEYKRVLGAKKIIWLKNGFLEEEWGLLENGIYGIGTGGHIDEFCRFVDANTLLLAEVDPDEQDPVARESGKRMELNYKILSAATDQDGKPFRIIRVPAAAQQTKKLAYKNLNEEEKSWFEKVEKDSVEFYLPTGYLNLIIANGVVVTSAYWKEGLTLALKERDDKARSVLSQAFPGRKIVQIDCNPLHHDGAGLHCHSRNQPYGRGKGHL